MEHFLVWTLATHHVLIIWVWQVHCLLLCYFIWSWQLMNIVRASLLVRITFIDGSIDRSNSSTSGLAWWTWCLWSTWASSYGIIIHITILIELNRFGWTLSTLDLIEWRLCILPGTSWNHAICILCIQSTANAGFHSLISWILCLLLLLIDNILLELCLLLWMLVGLFQWNLLNIHLLLHSSLADNRCLIRI